MQQWTNEDRTILVVKYPTHLSVATRPDSDALWGPPVRVERERTTAEPVDDPRALFLAGAGELKVSDLREWAEELQPGLWETIPQDEIGDDTSTAVTVVRP